MAEIEHTRGKAINPAPAPANEAGDKKQPLGTLQGRKGNAEISMETRLPKKSWISRLFAGGRPSFTSKSDRRTTQKAKPLENRKGEVQADKNTRPRFPKLREAYESFKNFFKGLRPRNWRAKTKNEPAVPVRNPARNEPALVQTKARNEPVVVDKAMIKEKYDAIRICIDAKVNELRLRISQEEERTGKAPDNDSEIQQQIIDIGTKAQLVEKRCQTIAEKLGDEVSESDRRMFNVFVIGLAGDAEVDPFKFLVPE